jgi:hypothetical protein
MSAIKALYVWMYLPKELALPAFPTGPPNGKKIIKT